MLVQEPTSMNLDQACAEIITYSVVHSVESLSAIEQMVKKFKLLTPDQQEAVTVFMEFTKVDA